MDYDPSKRVSDRPPDNSTEVSRIEIEFGIPVHVTAAQQRRLGEIIEEITGQPWNVPVDGVHWLAGVGSKPKFSYNDALFLGKVPEHDAPEETGFDDEVLHFETHARAFVNDKERARVLKERAQKAAEEGTP